MPLSNLFKKRSRRSKQQTPHKGPVNREGQELQKARVDAAMDVMRLFEQYFRPTERNVHPPTVLFAAACLAGTSLFRSFGYTQQSEPGTIILSEKANQEWPKLLQEFLFYLQLQGIKVDDKLATTFAEEHKPRKNILEIQKDLEGLYQSIMRKHGLDYKNGARAGAIVCAMLVDYHCLKQKDLPPEIGAGIVARGFVEGAKTSPMPLAEQEGESPSVQPAPRSGTKVSRFVIGDIHDVVADVQKNGGQYMQLHPKVVETLKQANIDPMLVYIRGVEQQLENKVERIDFVGLDLDKALGEEVGENSPIPIRLAHWLRVNASKYGYERDGNSWVLVKDNQRTR